ncbi:MULTISPECIES: GNAT family N-acetyltransferase [unclassified Streptomyces]|uniref:GNAT family N-acetyltransferase n=1 Tax=unclassified Streptomyces TaxID=2593676 RepID=UPI00224F7D45|nr:MULTISPECIES: GNAT family N-acetyltransferase [unclassified Streptomyces]MCX4632566.1 GNAT family N-acetyltransferase [Streptomyces sp. NBC_01443]WSW49223.1 GNAT family N-acetyltransferase [Streptomyces sp. NBC_01001]
MHSSLSKDLTELTTERLVLRTWTAAEAAAVLDCAGGTRPADWAGDFPSEGDSVIASLLGDNPAWLGTYGHRLIIERDSGLVVGSIGLFWPPTEGVLELGYGVVASRRGRGYATDAIRALAAFALTAPAVHTVAAGVELPNPASVRVLEKAGFERYITTAEDAGGFTRFAVTRHYNLGK